MTDTTYYASATPRRADGIPVGSARDAEFLRREYGMHLFAVTEASA
jgi:hypothetical protein